MTIRLTPSVASEITQGNHDLLARVAQKQDFYFDEGLLYTTYWSAEDEEIAARMMTLVAPGSYQAPYYNGQMRMRFIHETLEEPADLTFSMAFHSASGGKYAGIVPMGFSIAELYNKSPAVQAKVIEYIQLSYIVGTAKAITERLTDICTNLEQMRYLFPPVIRMLRMQHMDALANQIEDVRGAPRNLPPLDHHTKKCLRFLIQWYATQELLGGFEKGKPLPRKVNGERCIKLTGVHYIPAPAHGPSLRFDELI